jgi:hypothetical protein
MRWKITRGQPLYVQLVMHADKIKVFFGGLKAKKKDGQVPELNLKAAAEGCKQFTTAPTMRAEYNRRLLAGLMTKQLRMPTKKEQWVALLELNDIQVDNALTANDEESSHADGDDYDEGGGV